MGQQFEMLWIRSIMWDSSLVDMLRSNWYFYHVGIDLSTCWHPSHVAYCIVFESVQHVEMFLDTFFCFWIREWSTCWDPIEYDLLFGIRQPSTCWDSTTGFYGLGFESGQHAEMLCILSILLGLRVVSMLIFKWYARFMFDVIVVNIMNVYPCLLLPCIRACPTCWDSNGYLLLFWIREWSTYWACIIVFFYVGLERGQHVEILPMCSSALDLRVVNMLRVYEYGLSSGNSRVVNMLGWY